MAVILVCKLLLIQFNIYNYPFLLEALECLLGQILDLGVQVPTIPATLV